MNFNLIFMFFIVCSSKFVNSNLLKGTLVLASKLINVTNTEINDFINFKNLNGKIYEDDRKEAFALKNYIKNLLVIQKQNEKNKKGKSKFDTEPWMHSDLDEQTFADNLTGYKGRLKVRAERVNSFPSENIPAYVNYTEEGMVTRVMYQGMCGSCWAFSALGALESQLAKQTGRFAKLSEQNLIDCNKDEQNGNWGCGGGTMEAAYEYLKSQGGINTASSYKYTGNDGGPCKYNPRSSFGKLLDYVEIEGGNETLLMIALANVGPIAVAIDASQPTFMNYKSGIYDDPNCTELPNHGVLLVGYGTDEKLGKYWLLKNSWSTSWGERGYFRLARDQNNLCNIAFDPSYPIV